MSLTYVLLLSLAGVPGASAQTGGPRPGSKDPVRSYIFFPSHDVVAFAPGLRVKGYRADQNLQLGGAFSYDQPNDADQIVAAPGHIWRPQDEQVAYARRPNNGSDIHVTFVADPPTAGPSQVLPNLAPRLPQSADFMDIAAGDLDKLPDSAGDNHDEVVVAYASPGANNQMAVNVAVLDYTRPATTPPSPVAVVTAQASHPINGNDFTTPGKLGILPVDNVLGVAVGDFDFDGLKEIALVHLADDLTKWVTVFRYTNDGAGHRTLKEVSAAKWQGGGRQVGTVDVAAADFDGKGKDELIVAGSNYGTRLDGYSANIGFEVWQADDKLTMTMKRADFTYGVHSATFDDLGARQRVQLSPGLFKYDPANGFDLNRRQFVAAWNDGTDSSGRSVIVATYQVSDDLTTITQLKQSKVADPYLGINQRFSIAAGAYLGNTNTSPPSLWGVAVSYFVDNYFNLISLRSDLSVGSAFTIANAPLDGAGRYPVVPFDLYGKSVRLGAPVHFLIDGLVNTDFVLQEPPKHAFYDNRPQIDINGQPRDNPTYGQIVTVSRYDETNVALRTKSGTTFSGKSTDTSSWTIGGSAAFSSKTSVAEGIPDLASVKETTTVQAKVGYDYNQNKESYNSHYSERVIEQTERTDHDDKVLGRKQVIDIWRYRVYGLTTTDQNDRPTNPFYEVVLPGPTIKFDGGGLNFDWYQPAYENGNILSYPQASAGTFTPPDLGSYKQPCTSSTPNCEADGTAKVNEPMIAASQNFFDGTSGTLFYDFTSQAGSGNTFSYSHTLSESADIQFGTTITALDPNVDGASNQTSLSFNLHNSNSWAGATTSDTTTTSETGITLNLSAGDSTQAYAFYPVFYATKDGTVKVTHAVDVLGSSIGRSFWAGLYGRKADPALNLPSRFTPAYGPTGTLTGWNANYLSSRKKLRGFSLRKAEPNPVTNTYDLLGSTPLAGSTVRVETNVHNYSTAVAANGLKVRFDVINYDSNSDAEIKFTSCPGKATLQEKTGRCTVGETIVPQINPLQMTPAFINWDTTGFGPAGAGQSSEYRVYVVLDPDNAIDETYETEDPAADYKCVDNNGNPCTLPTGTDPGQNNEGFGYATVMHPSLSGARAASLSDARAANLLADAAPVSSFGSDVSLREDSLAARNDLGSIRTSHVPAQLHRPLSLRVKVYSDTTHDEFSHVQVYDGDPDGRGRMIASKVVHSGNQGGASAWFEWMPRRLGQHTLYAKIVEKSGDTEGGNHIDTLDVNVVPGDTTAPQLAVTLTPDTIWPALGQMVPITAHVSVSDDYDGRPEVKLESITHTEANDASADVERAEFGTDDRSFRLRAQRNGRFGLRERVYEVVYSATDWAGNKTYTTAYVTVPRRPR